ncbi:MAG: hypothetical protein ACRD0W_07495, partial [Acidimicrobiales bacterium]
DAPTYDPLTVDDVTGLLEKISDRPFWIVAANRAVPALAEHRLGVVQVTNRSAPHHMYGTLGHSRIVQPRQTITPVTSPRLMPGEQIGDRLGFASLSEGQFNALRSQYLNPRIAPSHADLPLGVTCDGKLIGVVAFRRSPFERSEAYLMSDFPVAPTSYQRLSKLVLLAALSREGQLLMQRYSSHRITHLTTTAFSDRPVSMKYRGIFHLDKRADSTDPAFRYMLNYSARMGERTLADALPLWRSRWGQPTVNEEPSGDAATNPEQG